MDLFMEKHFEINQLVISIKVAIKLGLLSVVLQMCENQAYMRNDLAIVIAVVVFTIVMDARMTSITSLFFTAFIGSWSIV